MVISTELKNSRPNSALSNAWRKLSSEASNGMNAFQPEPSASTRSSGLNAPSIMKSRGKTKNTVSAANVPYRRVSAKAPTRPWESERAE